MRRWWIWVAASAVGLLALAAVVMFAATQFRETQRAFEAAPPAEQGYARGPRPRERGETERLERPPAARNGGGQSESLAREAPAPDVHALVREELKKLKPGRVLFNPPGEMRVGDTERVEVRVSRDLEADLKEGLKGRGVPRVETVKVGTFMKVSLGGDGFDVAALNEEEQVVAGDGFTEWAYDVTPLASGERTLQLRVTVRIKLPGGEERKDYPVIERDIRVRVNPVFTVMRFVGDYWQWLATAIVIPLIVWAFNEWRRRRRAKTE